MKQYIEKSALVAEIEKKISSCYLPTEYTEGRKYGLGEALKIIDTIEVKEVDLEEKATQLSQKYFPDEENIWARPNIDAQRCKIACIEMVEWLKAQKGK